MIKSATFFGLIFFSLTAYAAGAPIPPDFGRASLDLFSAETALHSALADLKNKCQCNGDAQKSVDGAIGLWQPAVENLRNITSSAFMTYSCGKK
jgi:hypothetical protein